MQERLRQIPTQLLALWNKYSNKQKTIIICVAAAIIMSIVILGALISKTTYVDLIESKTINEASEVTNLLDKEGISNKLASDKLTIQVDKKSYDKAVLLLGENNIPSTGMSFEDAFNTSMSTTESQKEKKYALAFQNEVKSKLLNMSGIEDAAVYIHQPVDEYTILSEEQEASVSVMLTLSDSESMTSEKAQTLAVFLQNVVGNTNTDLISIIDSNYNLLFGGSSDSLLGGNVNSVIEYKTKLTNNIVNNVSKVLIKTGYDDVEVGSSNIKFNMDKVTELYTEYTPAEGQEQGLLSSSYNYSSEGTSGSTGVPGTDSNGDETTYAVDAGDNANSTTDITKNEYTPNERKTNTDKETGAVVPTESSMAIVLTQYNYIKEADLERQGLLDNTTWEDYILQNSARTTAEVDPAVYTTVAMTTGIAENKLSITAFTQPVFEAKVVEATQPTDWLMIILAVLIVALLIFVVFKGTAPVEVTEMEPELSVEQLLATTKENQSLEDIEFNEKSETRKMIEKFVDENPEAVAQLLRNWLNEDWG